MIIRAAAVAAAVLALVACQQQEAKAPAAPATPVADAVSGPAGADQAVGCMAYLALKQVALENQTRRAMSPPSARR